MDNHNPTEREREKERAKILIEELKILQGVTNRIAQKFLERKNKLSRSLWGCYPSKWKRSLIFMGCVF